MAYVEAIDLDLQPLDGRSTKRTVPPGSPSSPKHVPRLDCLPPTFEPHAAVTHGAQAETELSALPNPRRIRMHSQLA